MAELGAAFLSADLEITPEVRDDHAAYIGNWLTVLRNDKRFIFSAAAHAQRAADYLQSLHRNRPLRMETEARCKITGIVLTMGAAQSHVLIVWQSASTSSKD